MEKMMDSNNYLNVYPFYDQVFGHRKGLKKLIFKVIPVHAFEYLQSEWKLLLLRVKSQGLSRRYQGESELKVNIGAGRQGQPGWVNVDANASPGVNCLYDCRKQLPFPTGSVRAIFCEHFLEHLDYTEEAPLFIEECYRILQKQGVLRIIVPDAEKYIRAYLQKGWGELSKVRSLGQDHSDPFMKGRYHTKMELINVVFRQGHKHKYAYDAETLGFLLRRQSFSLVQQQDFGQSMMAELLLDQAKRASESLYMEAQK